MCHKFVNVVIKDNYCIKKYQENYNTLGQNRVIIKSWKYQKKLKKSSKIGEKRCFYNQIRYETAQSRSNIKGGIVRHILSVFGCWQALKKCVRHLFDI